MRCNHFEIISILCVCILLMLLFRPFEVRAQDDGFWCVRHFGAAGNGRIDDTPAFRTLLDRIGEEQATIQIIQGTYRVEGLTFPENITLAFQNGGMLHVPDNRVIGINGTIDAGIHQIFAGNGTVEGRIKNWHTYPQWFGAQGNGIQDDAPAIQKAANLAATAMGRTLFIPEGEYLFEENLAFHCNIESRGLLIKEMEIDEERTTISTHLYLPSHYPKKDPYVIFAPDHEEIELDMTPFHGIVEGQLQVPKYKDVPLADGSDYIDLKEGGTLRFYSSDFFTSRRVRGGMHYYDRNDITQMVSGRGDVFPEFAFDYHELPEAEPWSADAQYDKADYASYGGALFKATWPSGRGSGYEHNILGWADIGPVQPDPDMATTSQALEYKDGTKDGIWIWRRVATRAWYRPKDTPLRIDGLRVEVRLTGHEGIVKRIEAGAVNNRRSNITFNSPEVTVRDPEATMSRLFSSSGVVNVEVNNGYFSGATSSHLGYNILNSNVANIRYNDCISVNSRKGLDGRHSKNISIQGGFYNVIDDHYGRNFIIRDVVMTGLSVRVPNVRTPEVDLQAWHFHPISTFGFSGANVHIENIVIDRATGDILRARRDTGDLYGNIVLRNITVRRNEGDVTLFNHQIYPDFDYAHEVRVPDNVIIEDITLEHPGRLLLNIGEGFDGGSYGTVSVRHTGPIGRVFSTSPSSHFHNTLFEDAEFDIAEGAFVNIRNSLFSGENHGLDETRIGVASGNVRKKEAIVNFPLEYINKTIYSK